MKNVSGNCLFCGKPFFHKYWYGNLPKFCSTKCDNEYKRSHQPSIDSFIESKIERIPESGCWIWMGNNTGQGYGIVYRFNHKAQLLHRLVWEHFNNTIIPKGMVICHTCDVPSCIRPDHLFLGTPNDNKQDSVKKGRQRGAKGETNTKAKLAKNDIMEIRGMDAKIIDRVVAEQYSVDRSTIRRIRKGETWTHI